MIGWKKSTRCATNACVEVAMDDLGVPSGERRVRIRDSKAPSTGCVLSFTEDEWRAFIDGVKKGEFDLP